MSNDVLYTVVTRNNPSVSASFIRIAIMQTEEGMANFHPELVRWPSKIPSV